MCTFHALFRPKFVYHQQMNVNINDLFYSQYTHQCVSAGIPAIFRVNTNCLLVIRTSPCRWLDYWPKQIGENDQPHGLAVSVADY
jgi:hypothetical protein